MARKPRAGKDAATGRFLPGNRFWAARSRRGPRPKFETPEQLWEACVDYFDWVEANPLWEDRLVTFRGRAHHEPVAKMRAMTLAGLCLFLDVAEDTWREWRASRPDLGEPMRRAEAIIRTQKFEGAAADLLNAAIIARDLGLADRAEITGRDGGPIRTEEVSARERLAERIARLAARAGADGADRGA